MAPAFRAVANTSYAARTDTTVAKPTGTVNDDIMILIMMAGSSTSQAATLAVTPPAGWTLIGTTISQTQSGGGFHGAFYAYWKRASSEGANYTLTHSTLSTQAVIASYSGCIATGSPIDVFSQNNGLTTTSTGTSVTTTLADTKLVYGAHNWTASGALTPPTGMTERYDLLAYLADEDRASAGATGNRTQTIGDAVWQVYMVALKPLAGGVSVTANVANPALLTTSAGDLSVSISKIASVTNPALLTTSAGTLDVTAKQNITADVSNPALLTTSAGTLTVSTAGSATADVSNPALLTTSAGSLTVTAGTSITAFVSNPALLTASAGALDVTTREQQPKNYIIGGVGGAVYVSEVFNYGYSTRAGYIVETYVSPGTANVSNPALLTVSVGILTVETPVVGGGEEVRVGGGFMLEMARWMG